MNSIAQPSGSQFLKQYQTNAQFVQNLRKQSNKIQQMLAYIDKLKSDCQLKDRLISQLKRRQSDAHMQIVRTEEIIRDEYIGKVKIMSHCIQQLESQIAGLRNQLQLVQERQKSTVGNTQFGNIQIVHRQQIDRLMADLQHSKKQGEKWKQKYQSCKQQCAILHIELQDYRKNMGQLQQIIKHNQIKNSQNQEQYQNKCKKLRQEVQLAQKQKILAQQRNKQLENHLRKVENELLLQISKYQEQIGQIMRQVAKVEEAESIWKRKYYQLEQTVNHIESLRQNWRIQKNYGNNAKQENKKIGNRFHGSEHESASRVKVSKQKQSSIILQQSRQQTEENMGNKTVKYKKFGI